MYRRLKENAITLHSIDVYTKDETGNGRKHKQAPARSIVFESGGGQHHPKYFDKQIKKGYFKNHENPNLVRGGGGVMVLLVSSILLHFCIFL